MVVYDIRDLVKVYPGQTQPANKNISLQIHQGEVFGLLGENGAGKSTLVRQMVNLTRSTSGSITLFGQSIERDPMFVPMNVGYMPQDGLALNNLTADEALYFTSHLRGLSRADAWRERARLLDTLQLGELRERIIPRLSGGQRRLLQIAIAMAASPPVLILDEPTNNLDPQRRRLVWDALRQVNQQQGTTIIFITHDAIEAEKVIQHSLLIQLFDLWLIQLSNWRWSWRSRLVIDTLAPLVSIVGLSVFAGPEALAYILAGNLVLNLMFGNLDKVGSHFAYMRMVGTLSYFATLPIRRYALVLATVLSCLVMSFPSLIITTLIGALILNISLTPNAMLLLVVPLVAIPLASLGALIGVSVSRPESAGSLSLLATVVLTATGPVVVPPSRLPNWLLALGKFSPGTYAASAFRQALLGPVTPRIWLDLIVLAGFAVVISWLVVRRMDWRQSE